jgi:hypothetical protein
MRAHVAAHLRVDPLGRAAQRQLAQGREVAGLEEVLDRARGLLGDVDLAVLSRWVSSSGVMSTSSISAASSSTLSGTVSRTCTRVIRATMSFRLSRCWMLTVLSTSMPAASSSSMSW